MSVEHDFDPVWEGCSRCGALPGEDVACLPEEVSHDDDV